MSRYEEKESFKVETLSGSCLNTGSLKENNMKSTNGFIVSFRIKTGGFFAVVKTDKGSKTTVYRGKNTYKGKKALWNCLKKEAKLSAGDVVVDRVETAQRSYLFHELKIGLLRVSDWDILQSNKIVASGGCIPPHLDAPLSNDFTRRISLLNRY